MKQQLFSEIGLLTCALFWGASGVLTQIVLGEMSPMALIFFRFAISGILGLIVFRFNPFRLSKETHRHGLVLSLLLMVMYISSTYGLKYTSASNAGFIIGSSVILVPLFNRILFRVELGIKDYLSAALCLIGLGLVTLRGAQPLNIGDIFCFIDAIAYALYIIYNSRLPKQLNVKILSTVQYTYVSIWSLFYLFFFEHVPLKISLNGLFAIIILGVLCTFLAFLIQVAAQRHTSAERTGRIMTLIPIFTVFLDFFVYGKVMSVEALFGGGLIVFTVMFMDLVMKKIAFTRPL